MEVIFEELDLFKAKINSSENICLMSHANPDGDSVGSVLALATFIIENMGNEKNVNIVIKDEIPSNLKFMPNISLIKTDIEYDKVDLLITLDCASTDRLGIDESILNSIKYTVNIDHHVTNTQFGNINFIDSEASSTGEVVYDLIKSMNYDISKDIATCIYVSMSTDTGSFKYTNTSSKTHLIVSKLLDKHIDLEMINVELYQNRSIEKTMLLMEGIKNLELYEDNKVGIVSISKEILDSCKAKSQDAEIIVNFIRDIDTIQVACSLREIDEGTVKASLRSKQNIDVSKVALKFNGGGHAKAAGCTIYSNLSEAKEQIKREIIKAFR